VIRWGQSRRGCSIGCSQNVKVAVSYHPVTPVACHTFICDMLAVNGSTAGGQERNRSFGVAVAALARLYGR